MATQSSILAWRILCTEEPGSPWGRKESYTTEWLYFHFSHICLHIYFTFTFHIVLRGMFCSWNVLSKYYLLLFLLVEERNDGSVGNVRDNKLKFRDFGLRCVKISDSTTGYLQTKEKKPCFFQNNSSFIFNENDANYWVLTQDEFLFDELYTALQKT